MVRFSKRRDTAGPLIFGPGPRARARRRRRRRPRSLGDLEDPVEVSVRALQEALVRAGYDVGPTGVDNRWGPNTRGALLRFLRRIGYSGDPIELNSETRTFSIESAVWSRLSSATPGSGGESQSSASSGGGGTRTTSQTDPGSAVDRLEAEEEGMSGWQIALLGGGVLLLTGAIAYSITAALSDDDEDEVRGREAELLPQF